MAYPDEPAEDEARAGTSPRLARAGAAVRSVAIDLSPLRASREFRLLWVGELISTTGRQITIVALAFQVFVLTDSSFAVGLIGLVELLPLVVCSIVGGAVADRVDRRKLLIATEVGLAGTSSLLLVGAIWGHPPLGYLYGVTGLQAGILGVNHPTRSAAIPNMVSRDQLPAALALNQVMFNTTMIVGPAAAGVILGNLGLTWAYAADVTTFVASIGAVIVLRPLPPKRDEAERPTGWQDIKEGFRYLRRKRVLVSTFLIDLDAMIFGMPRAVFPVLALDVLRVGPSGLGLLYAAPAAGALLGALTAGWVGRIRHQGRAVIWAVVLWGLCITAFGISRRLFWIALLFLAAAGAADVISAVFRGSILQLSVPDSLRGRLSAIHIMVVTGGPRLGDLESGAVATLVSPVFAVVSGGVACVVGALLLARLYPELGRSATEAEPPSGPSDGGTRPGST